MRPPELAVPLVVALAVAGLGAGGAGLRARFDPWAAGAGIAAYAVYAAPTVATGEATFAGYVKLDDTATWLGTLDYVLEHGTHVTGLAPSTYETMLALWLGEGYPVGSLVPLGVTRIVDVDPAWTWQPYLSFLGALLALVLYELDRRGRTLAEAAGAGGRDGELVRAPVRVRPVGRREGALCGGPARAARGDRVARVDGSPARGPRAGRRRGRLPRRPQRGGGDLARAALRRGPASEPGDAGPCRAWRSPRSGRSRSPCPPSSPRQGSSTTPTRSPAGRTTRGTCSAR